MFLWHEIQAIKVYQEGQTMALQGARLSLETLCQSQVEIEAERWGVHEKTGDAQKRAKDMGKETISLKDQLTELMERR